MPVHFINPFQVEPSFVPTDLPGCFLWLKADSITGLSDGDPVAAWTDLSGLGNNVGQSTASLRPTWRTGVLGSRPVVRGDGVDDRLVRGSASVTGASAASDWMQWAVVSLRATGGAASQVFLYLGQGATHGYGMAAKGATLSRKAVLFGGVSWLNSSVAESTGFEIWVLQRRPVASPGLDTTRLWINGGAPKLISTTSPNAGAADINLFHNNVHAAPGVDIFEAGMHHTASSLSDANAIGAYLAQRSGLTWTTATDS